MIETYIESDEQVSAGELHRDLSLHRGRLVTYRDRIDLKGLDMAQGKPSKSGPEPRFPSPMQPEMKGFTLRGLFSIRKGKRKDRDRGD